VLHRERCSTWLTGFGALRGELADATGYRRFGGSHAQREAIRQPVTHVECRRRAAIDSANSSAPTTSPRASSASDSTRRRRVSGSDSTDKVSSTPPDPPPRSTRQSVGHARHRDTFMMSVDPSHQLREARLHIGERHCRYSQNPCYYLNNTCT
jgi:hypothetical protein